MPGDDATRIVTSNARDRSTDGRTDGLTEMHRHREQKNYGLVTHARADRESMAACCGTAITAEAADGS